MPKILDLAYAAVLVGGGFQGVLSRWAGVGSAVVVLALGAKLKSVVSLVLTLALSRRWGALGTTYATAVPAVLTAVMTFLYATQKKTMKARKMAPMVEEPTRAICPACRRPRSFRPVPCFITGAGGLTAVPGRSDGQLTTPTSLLTPRSVPTTLHSPDQAHPLGAAARGRCARGAEGLGARQVKGWGYSKVKFEQDHSDHSVRLVGDKHYPDLSGKRIPHLISFVCEMTVQPPPLPRRRRRRRRLSSAAVAGHQLGGVQHGAPGAPPAAARNGSSGLVPTVGGRPQGDATVECFQDHVAGTNPLSAAAKAALAAAFPNREGLPDQVEYDEHSRQERSRGGYFAYVIPTNVRMVGAASAIATPGVARRVTPRHRPARWTVWSTRSQWRRWKRSSRSPSSTTSRSSRAAAAPTSRTCSRSRPPSRGPSSRST